MSSITHQEDIVLAQAVMHIAAEFQNIFSENRSTLELVGGDTGLELVPNLLIGDGVNIHVGVALKIHPLDFLVTSGDKNESFIRARVDEFF